jgi:uncharacterized RDD family membrane protein YckC
LERVWHNVSGEIVDQRRGAERPVGLRQRISLRATGMLKSAKLDTSVTIVTPENIEFSYRLAGPFRRLGAFLVDLLIKLVFLIVLSVFAGLAGLFATIGEGLTSFILLVTSFLMDWFYGMLWETMWSGQTPGKKVFSLRVISCDGRPINGVQAAIRNLLRVADLGVPASIQIFSPDAPPGYIFPTFTVGFISMALTKRFQRIGDLAADTMVIVEERAWQPVLFKIDDARAEALAEFIPADFVVPLSMAKALSLYVAKRSKLPLLRRQELAKHLAEPLIAKFGFMSDTSPDLMLCALYLHAFYSSSQQRTGPRHSLSPFKKSVSQGDSSQTVLAAVETIPSPSSKGMWDILDQPRTSDPAGHSQAERIL